MMKAPSSFLTPSERQDLIKAHRFERDGRLKDRLKTILWLDQGWSYEKIAQALFLDDQTVRNYDQAYREKKKEGLLSLKYKGRPTKLTSCQCEELKAYLDEVTHLTAKAIVEYIKQTYDIVYARKGVMDLLHRLGFVYKKPKLMPGFPDPVKQEAFLKMYKNLRENLKEEDEIVFLDSVHPQHNARAGYGWILKGKTKELPTNTGRHRLHITGALNVKKMDVTWRYDKEKVNTYSILHVLLDIRKKYPKAQNIYVILDNAAYNHAKLLKRAFDKTPIKFVFLPPYSPNLNLIERLWRFFHKKVTEFKHYKTFQEFKDMSLSFFEKFKDYEPELRTLLVENFNIIGKTNSKIITA